MNEFVTVVSVNEIPPETGRIVEVNGILVALFNVDGAFYALDNTCPHAGGPLGEGTLAEGIVKCPWHGWQFDLRTGMRVGNPDFAVPCCLVRIVGDQVQIALPANLL